MSNTFNTIKNLAGKVADNALTGLGMVVEAGYLATCAGSKATVAGVKYAAPRLKQLMLDTAEETKRTYRTEYIAKKEELDSRLGRYIIINSNNEVAATGIRDINEFAAKLQAQDYVDTVSVVGNKLLVTVGDVELTYHIKTMPRAKAVLKECTDDMLVGSMAAAYSAGAGAVSVITYIPCAILQGISDTVQTYTQLKVQAKTK